MNFQNYQNSMLLTSSDTKRTLRHLFLSLRIPPRENWFQYVRRVYATAINFPCITFLILRKITFKHMCQVVQHHNKSFIAPSIDVNSPKIKIWVICHFFPASVRLPKLNKTSSISVTSFSFVQNFDFN